ncbi:TPA: hypothetical protein ACTY1G_001393, partial [Klebsiella michiganensis]
LLCHGMVCVVGRMRDLILQLSKSSIYSTKPGSATRMIACSLLLTALLYPAEYVPDKSKLSDYNE